MVSLVKAFIFYSLIKQSEFLYCFASPLGGHANQPPPCGQYGFRCTTSHEYEICVESDDGSDIGIPAINHSCPRDMLCDEDNESYCSLPDDGRDSIILVGKPHFGLDCDVSDLKYDNAFELRRRCELQTNERQNDAVNLNIQKNTAANFVDGGNSDDDGGRDRKLMDKVVGNDYESPELCITPPAPFECDMLGYFAGDN